ncbi:MAG: glutathione S-transferase family protein [Chloroflexota bacterium]
MKLYQFDYSPNSRRVRIYLAEKGISVPCVDVDISRGQSHSPEYVKINPMGEVPALEMDDGSVIAESLAICRYFEALQPEPNLFGVTPNEIAVIEMWQRRIELKWFAPMTQYWLHSAPMYAQRLRQIPELVEQNRAAINQFVAWLDGEMANREYIAGDRYSIADILALVTMDHGNWAAVGCGVSPELKHLARWHQTVSSRPSAQA